MAQKKFGWKSQMLREYFAKHPQASWKDAPKNITKKVTPAQFYLVRGQSSKVSAKEGVSARAHNGADAGERLRQSLGRLDAYLKHCGGDGRSVRAQLKAVEKSFGIDMSRATVLMAMHIRHGRKLLRTL